MRGGRAGQPGEPGTARPAQTATRPYQALALLRGDAATGSARWAAACSAATRRVRPPSDRGPARPPHRLGRERRRAGPRASSRGDGRLDGSGSSADCTAPDQLGRRGRCGLGQRRSAHRRRRRCAAQCEPGERARGRRRRSPARLCRRRASTGSTNPACRTPPAQRTGEPDRAQVGEERVALPGRRARCPGRGRRAGCRPRAGPPSAWASGATTVTTSPGRSRPRAATTAASVPPSSSCGDERQPAARASVDGVHAGDSTCGCRTARSTASSRSRVRPGAHDLHRHLRTVGTCGAPAQTAELAPRPSGRSSR